MPKTPAPRIIRNLAIGIFAIGALFGAFFVRMNVISELHTDMGCPKSLQYSYFSTPDVFDAAYREAASRPPDHRLRGLIVPHHLLAARYIAEAFEAVATERSVTVVLVSPNHFMAGRDAVITTPSVWETPYGRLESDCEVVERLARSGAAAIEEMPFAREHGISGIVPFIKKSLPHARIVPLIVKETATDEDIAAAVRGIRDAVGSHMLVVGSFDFSHELTDTAARFHDRKSLAVLRSLDDAGARAIDIDSTQGLRLVMRVVDSIGARRFSLFAQSNSSVLSGQPGQPDVTSYLIGAYQKGERDKDDTITLLTVGDMMLARGVEATIQSKGMAFLFDGMRRLYRGSDITTANAEGVFVDVDEARKPVRPDDLQFPFEPAWLSTIARAGFTHLGLANNHSSNFGTAALNASRALIRGAGMETFGDPAHQDETTSLTVVRDRRVAQIGYHQFGGTGADETVKAIEAAKKDGAFVVVYPHWGIEYERHPSRAQVTLAHRFIDAGADVIIGSHPHVVQPIEVYHGKAIFYSLGNFIFDQTFSAPTSEGLAVGIANDGKETVFHLMPFDIRDGQPSLMSYEKGRMVLQMLARDSVVSDELKASIAASVFTLSPTL